MDTQPATKRSVVLVALLALASFTCLAFETRAAGQGKDAEGKSHEGKPVDLKQEGELLFNGRDFSGWKFRDNEPARVGVWKVAEAQLDAQNPKRLIPATGPANPEAGNGNMLRGEGHGTDLFTERTFGDCQLHIEFMIPDGSNSGVYLQGQYEVQVFSSVGKPDDKLAPSDCGGIYNTKAPSANPLKPYGQWNSFDITFRAPRFDAGGKKTENAKFIQVVLNGKEIQKDVDTPKPTGSQLPGGEVAKGPLLLQGDHGIVAFRNVRIKELELK